VQDSRKQYITPATACSMTHLSLAHYYFCSVIESLSKV
jgi:hypothetical protein